MTTIAIKDGVMAADSRVTGDSTFCHVQKIQRLNANSIAAFVGEAFVGLTLIAWLRTKRLPAELHKIIPPDSRDDAYAVELSSKGIDVWNGYGVAMRVTDPCFATGSGGQAARAAMLLGDTAEAAVKVAIRLDEGSGPPVQVEPLKPIRKKR